MYEREDDVTGTAFRDMITLALAGFVSLVMIMIPYISLIQTEQGETKSPGDLAVEIDWPSNIDADVDLWVLAPGDIPIGYSNKGGAVFNLLRDDLGHFGDRTPYNHESAYTRGLPAGEYVVNVHAYRNLAGVWPIPVTVSVILRPPSAPTVITQELTTTVELTRLDQELTAFSFVIQSDRIDMYSVNHIYQPVRSLWLERGGAVK